MSQQKHIIHKINVEVAAPDIATARLIHSNITDCLYALVLPAVEAELDKAIAADQYCRMDGVTMDISLESQDEMKTSLPHMISSSMLRQLSKLFSKTYKFPPEDGSMFFSEISERDKGLEHKSVAQKRWEIFIYFLSTGNRPWYAGAENWLEEEMLLDEVMAYHSSNIQTFKKALRQPVARQRLLNQFNQQFILQLIEKLFTIPVSDYIDKLKALSSGDDLKNSEVLEKEFILNTLTKIAEDRAEPLTEAGLHNFFDAVTNPAPGATDKMEEKQKNEIVSQERLAAKKKKLIPAEEDGLFVQNAGVVLLHPFLLYFFTEFDLITENQFKDEAAQQTAIHLLHYLASGKKQAYEYDLLFEKYLCGLRSDEPLERFVSLTGKMKEESDNLLRAAIHHWKVLKSTSPEGLREGFLQRNGKLILSPHQHRLIVETNTIDILLDQLPWGYSMIQLPWMQQLLYVDWITS